MVSSTRPRVDPAKSSGSAFNRSVTRSISCASLIALIAVCSPSATPTSYFTSHFNSFNSDPLKTSYRVDGFSLESKKPAPTTASKDDGKNKEEKKESSKPVTEKPVVKTDKPVVKTDSKDAKKTEVKKPEVKDTKKAEVKDKQKAEVKDAKKPDLKKADSKEIIKKKDSKILEESKEPTTKKKDSKIKEESKRTSVVNGKTLERNNGNLEAKRRIRGGEKRDGVTWKRKFKGITHGGSTDGI
jgi:hypothetical protein